MTNGTEIFARYAYAPNRLGFCGPPEAVALRGGSDADVRAVARQFSGAWPYLWAMSRLTGISDPLDYRLVESYWLGGGVGARLDPAAFAAELLAVIGPLAGHYWTHLTEDLAAEAAANHCFHVFGVYPWTRLLGKDARDQPRQVLDGCRISWGTVIDCTPTDITLSSRRLRWDGRALSLSDPEPQRAEIWTDGYSAVPDVTPGDQVAVHWNRLCGHLTSAQVHDLESSTLRQLHVTNRRLTAAR
ncbi:DUF6390 family protein [Nocardia altamirensis]|uniref:DUF6390 family protein n=1 Tax=Nocardia altamirensis TaxID=472158 RepID=UPI000AA426AF|nr:DUF6390 family protein [Nocardia altamirensis]